MKCLTVAIKYFRFLSISHKPAFIVAAYSNFFQLQRLSWLFCSNVKWCLYSVFKRKNLEALCLGYVILVCKGWKWNHYIWAINPANISALAGSQRTALNMQWEGSWNTATFRAHAKSRWFKHPKHTGLKHWVDQRVPNRGTQDMQTLWATSISLKDRRETSTGLKIGEGKGAPCNR